MCLEINEGFGWMIHHFDKIWSHPKQRNFLLDTIRKLENSQDLMAISTHMMVYAKK